MTRHISVLALHTQILITYLFLLPLASSQSLTCYWPNGEVADSAYTPCSENGGTCCYDIDDAHKDLCYDNGMCYSLYWGRKYRGACTDQSWSSGSGCATECLTFEPGDSATLADCADAQTCCGFADNATSCCADGGGFYWNNATFILQQASTVAATTSTVTETASQGTGTVAASSQTETQTSSSPTGTLNADALQLATSQCNKDKIALGAGLGLPLGISLFAAAALGFLLLRRRGQYVAPPDQAFNAGHATSELPEKLQHHYNASALPQELPYNPQIHEMNGR